MLSILVDEWHNNTRPTDGQSQMRINIIYFIRKIKTAHKSRLSFIDRYSLAYLFKTGVSCK